MDCLVENLRPRDWFFWLGEAAYANSPPYLLIGDIADLEKVNLLPGAITWVDDRPWGRF